MAENTTVGPGGATSSAMPVTPHQTHGHLDDTNEGGLTSAGGSDSGDSTVGPAGGYSDFSGADPAGESGVEPSDLTLSGESGPVEPLGFNG